MSTLPRQPVLVEREGALGHITLNRPAAINALTLEMVATDRRARSTASSAIRPVRHVLLDGAGERGFCAGGDIIALHAAMQAGDRDVAARTFWQRGVPPRRAHPRLPEAGRRDHGRPGHGRGRRSLGPCQPPPRDRAARLRDARGGHRLRAGRRRRRTCSRARRASSARISRLTGERIGCEDAAPRAGWPTGSSPSRALPGSSGALRERRRRRAVAATARPPRRRRPALAAARVWIDALLLGRHRGGDPRTPARASRGGCSSVPPSDRDEVADRRCKVALRALRQARGLPTLEACLRAGAARVVRLPRRARLHGGHPRGRDRQGPQPALVARPARGRVAGRHRSLRRADMRHESGGRTP